MEWSAEHCLGSLVKLAEAVLGVPATALESRENFGHHGLVNFAKIVAGVLLMVGLLTACNQTTAPAPLAQVPPAPTLNLNLPREAQPKLNTIKVWIGAEQLDAEMAITPREEATGMMFRTSMGENEAMLFVLQNTQQASFWMMNCPLPLSLAYIDPEGVIQEIHDLQPHNTNSVISASNNIRFALETPQGWFKRHNIEPGKVVHTERGSLADVFLLR